MIEMLILGCSVIKEVQESEIGEENHFISGEPNLPPIYSTNQIIAEAFRSVREFLNVHQQSLDKIEKRLHQLEAKIQDFNALKTVVEKLEKQVMKIDSLEKLVQNDVLENRLDKLEQQVQLFPFEEQQIHLYSLKKQVEKLEQGSVKKLVNNFNELKSSLDRLKELETTLNDITFWSQKTAQVLPQAFRIEQQNDHEKVELMESLQRPVEECIRHSINQDTRPFSDALFPVMGPAIRKSINESFKTITQSINRTVEQSLSRQGLLWRWEAFRTGRSFSEIVLQHTLLYRVEEVFLIHRETGLLIQHLHQDDLTLGDRDAVSAMLTAIQDFIRDSFSTTKNEELDSVEIGEYTVWIERGPYVALACVIRGIAPYRVRNIMRSILESLHARYGLLLRQFSGDSTPLQPCKSLLEKVLLSETKSEARKSFFSFPLIAIIALILLILFGWGYQHFEYQQRLTNYIETLRKTPGIVVISNQRQGGKLFIYGMRDPLAEEPRELARRFDLNQDDVVSQWISYQDLSNSFVERRLQQRLKPPHTVQMSVQDSVLHLSGHAPADWINQATKVGLIEGITSLDISKLFDTDEWLLKQAQHELAPPENVTLIVQDGILRVSGLVDSITFNNLQKQLNKLSLSSESFAGFDTTALINAKLDQDKLIQNIEKTNFYFLEGVAEWVPGQETSLQVFLKNVQQLLLLSQSMTKPMRLQIIGDTDGTGSKRHNQQLAQQRAETMLDWLHHHGIEKTYLIITPSPIIRFGENRPNPVLRKVSFQVDNNK